MINIKADAAVKREAQQLARKLGLSLSDVLNASLRNFIRTREVRVSDIPEMTTELERMIAVAERDLRSGRNVSPPLKSGNALARRLDRR